MTPRLNKTPFALLLATAGIVAMAIAGKSFVSSSGTAVAAQPKKSDAVAQYTDDGALKQPVGYREWVYVGTPLTPNDMNDGEASFPEFHAVYIDPASLAHYKETGKFRDGTVLVKELSAVGSKEASSGNGYFMGEFTGLEATVKDSKRFKDEPGNWAYFSFGHKYPLKKTAKAQKSFACNSCHENNANDDWVFTQYYPVLRAAKPKK
jgi:hypothetical protein